MTTKKEIQLAIKRGNSFGWKLCEGWEDMDQDRIAALVEAIRLMDKDGYNQAQALREVTPALGIGNRALYNWAAVRGMPLPNPGLHQTAHMTEAIKTYAKEHRLDLGNRLIDIVEEAVSRMEAAMTEDEEYVPEIRELREMAITFGILTDKRRLEDGDATTRTEVSTESVRLEIAAKLEQLEQRGVGVVTAEGDTIGAITDEGEYIDAEIVDEGED